MIDFQSFSGIFYANFIYFVSGIFMRKSLYYTSLVAADPLCVNDN